MHDSKFAFRQLFKSPGFTAVAVLTLALGIGANTAIFSIVDQLLNRPLPVPAPERLAVVARAGEDGRAIFSFNHVFFTDLRERSQSFSHLVATAERPVGFSTGDTTERLSGLFVSGDYFRMLGLEAALGRLFAGNEGLVIGDGPVAVISHGLWQRRFGADPGVVGRAVSISGRPFTIIGVAPREFAGTQRGSVPDLYVPMTLFGEVTPRTPDGEDPLVSRLITFHEIMGRLRAGASHEAAEAELRTLAVAIRNDLSDPDAQIETNLLVLPGAQGSTGELRAARLPLNLLQVTAGLVLLIACANLANLQLARALNRSREFAIRLALGARRRQVMHGLLTESVLLALIGGGAGVLLAWWLTPVLEMFRPPDSNFELASRLDFRLLTFAILVSALTGLVFGLAPAWRASRPQLVPELKGAASDTSGGTRWSLRNLLVGTQVALAVLVLAGAGLCARSLGKLKTVGEEFAPSAIALLSLDPDLNGYGPAQAEALYEELLARTRALPGIESASLARTTPMSGRGIGMSLDRIEGYEMKEGEWAMAHVNVVAPGYFRTLNLPLLQGRDFDSTDARPGAQTVIVNEAFVHRYWPDGNALGRRLFQGGFGPNAEESVLEVVGVVRASSLQNPTDDVQPMMFRPLAQWDERALTLVARTGLAPSATLAQLQELVRSLDANLPVFDVRTLAQQRDGSLAMQRMSATLLGGFGVLALLLAALGIYGVLAYSVSRRTREIGVRMALGADLGAVVRLVLRQGIRLALTGAVVGLLAAAGLTQLVRSFLFGVSPLDPVTFGGVLLLLAGVSLLACWLPARRAAKVDPMVALRSE